MILDICPTLPIIHRVLSKMKFDNATGVIGVPCWKSTVVWPILCQNGNFVSSVKDWTDLPTSKELCTRCKSGKGIFGNIDLIFRMIALFLDFSKGD